MAKKTIRDCIVEVLRDAGQPMGSKEVFDAIIAKDLYQFNTVHPSNVVRSQLRRHCKNLKRKDSAEGCFEMTGDGKFKLAES